MKVNDNQPQSSERDNMATIEFSKLGTKEDAINRAGARGGAGHDSIRNAGEDGPALDDQLPVGDPDRRRDRHPRLLFSLLL